MRFHHEFGDHKRHFSQFTHDQGYTRGFCVARQVEGTPISTAYDLNPAKTCQKLGINTKLGVVSVRAVS